MHMQNTEFIRVLLFIIVLFSIQTYIGEQWDVFCGVVESIPFAFFFRTQFMPKESSFFTIAGPYAQST